MLSLIAREIRDNLVGVTLPFIISAGTIGLMIYAFFWDIGDGVFVIPGLLMLLSFIAFCGLGAGQMYGDRANRVSALLATLAATRNRIFFARVVVGAVTVLAALVPVAVAVVFLLNLRLVHLEFHVRTILEVSVTTILVGFACYCIGLQVGWTTSKARLLFGIVLWTAVVTSIVWAKGFGPWTMLLLLLFIAATLVHAWHTFTSTSL